MSYDLSTQAHQGCFTRTWSKIAPAPLIYPVRYAHQQMPKRKKNTNKSDWNVFIVAPWS